MDLMDISVLAKQLGVPLTEEKPKPKQNTNIHRGPFHYTDRPGDQAGHQRGHIFQARAGMDNGTADTLSHFQFERFCELAQGASNKSVQMLLALWNLSI